MRFAVARSLATLCLAGGVLADSVADLRAQAPTPVRTTGITRAPRASSPGLSAGKYVVVIDLDTNRLYFTRNRRILWSAPVGTGTGLRLEGPEGEWDFSTPNGVYHVQFKEENPVWLAPDWYFVENNLPIPPANSSKRRFPGGLGAAAVYIGDGLAIHGTDKPDLLGQRVSHGCIRLSNRDALRLFHNVQAGTEVVITGGEGAYEDAADRAPASRPRVVRDTRAAAPVRDEYAQRLASLATDDLLLELDDEVRRAADQQESRWPQVAAVVMRRGVKEGDEDALRGLLLQMEVLQTGRIAQEYATFLVDAYGRAPQATLRALAGLDRVARSRAAAAIVDATMTLYPGSLEDQVAPWPTRRLPETAVEYEGERGWDAIRQAEISYRERQGLATSQYSR
ncbi:MAG TPA: L,D-transpeptidase [Longimicrobiaceae bacterium]|nr:L,D-transpeptidase [Longimicrobiaceae bacterium]